jgi:predicted glycogen debranching enzyme
MGGLDVAALSLDGMLQREWLVTNGLGGFACSTVASLNTRKYHGLLVAAMAPPVRRMVLLSRVEETIRADGRAVLLACNEYPGTIHPHGHTHLAAFNSEPHPRWAYQSDGWTIEKELRLIHGENTVLLSYTLLAGDKPVELELAPLLALRGIHELSYQWNGRLTTERSRKCRRLPATSRTPEVFFAHDGEFRVNPQWNLNTIYRRERERGYSGLEDLWTPGLVRCVLSPGHTVHFACSTEPLDLERVVSKADRQPATDASKDHPLGTLRRACEQFIVDVPRESEKEPAVAVVSNYPWGSPASRAALIGFSGLFLVTGKFEQGRALLLSLAGQLKNGLAPSDWPEDGSAPRHLSADTSLWFVHAVHQYLRYTGDETTVKGKLFDAIAEILKSYQHGTDLGIAMDADGLIASHVPGMGTSWMDAKVGDWVITPRAGKPVELNALWYNAVCVAGEMADRFARHAWTKQLSQLTDTIKTSFNAKFWNEREGCCFDVIDEHGRDESIRPNQLLAISLPFAVLSMDRHAAVLEKVKQLLLTPFGLRTLAPTDPNYQGRYEGNVVTRDRAYHQGSVHPWLLGPFVSAFLRVHGRGAKVRQEAAAWLEPCLNHLRDAGHGHLAELFDGDEPHRPGGAIACAPAVAELLRCHVEEILDQQPTATRKIADIVFSPKIQGPVKEKV